MKKKTSKSPLQVQESYTYNKSSVSRPVKWGRWEGEALGFDSHGFKFYCFCSLLLINSNSKPSYYHLQNKTI